jgi:hypothetical protein
MVLVRTDVSEEHVASIFTVEKIQLLTLFFAREPTWRHIPEDGILQM